VGSSAAGTGRGRQNARLGRRGRRSRLVPRTPALQHKISLGLQGPILKRDKETGQLAQLCHVVRERSLVEGGWTTALCYAAPTAANSRCA
jgi:hypothetical protein